MTRAEVKTIQAVINYLEDGEIDLAIMRLRGVIK
jgi:hypothetical protein